MVRRQGQREGARREGESNQTSYALVESDKGTAGNDINN